MTRLRDGAMKQTLRHWRGQQAEDVSPACAFTKNRDVILISAKQADISLGPAKRLHHIQCAEIGQG